jgi:hypothetical protein
MIRALRIGQVKTTSRGGGTDRRTATETTTTRSEGESAVERHARRPRRATASDSQVRDVARSWRSTRQHLGFTLETPTASAFASVSLGEATILLSGPRASGSRPMPNGAEPGTGGWNRVVLRVENLSRFIETLNQAGLHFR